MLESIEDLRIPPGNRLEGLKGDRSGQYSIRINRSWRICFDWSDGDAHNGKRSISAETSLLLGKALGMSERFWLNLQVDYDFRMARRAFEEKGEMEITPLTQ